VSAGVATETSTGELPEVEIEASATANEVRALEDARTESSVSGKGEVRKEDFTRRKGLPHRLEPGAVYRDVRIHWRLAGRTD
jgi:hypothetical protein